MHNNNNPSAKGISIKRHIISSDNVIKFDDRFVEKIDSKLKPLHRHTAITADTKDDEIKLNHERIWPKTNNFRKNRKNKMEKEKSDNQPKNLIALASFPGSGNTWLRYLLQQATGNKLFALYNIFLYFTQFLFTINVKGILTGSVYKDFGLLKSGFPAENIYNSSVRFFFFSIQTKLIRFSIFNFNF